MDKNVAPRFSGITAAIVALLLVKLLLAECMVWGEPVLLVVFFLLFVASAIGVLTRRGVVTLVVEGCLVAFWGWIVWEGVKRNLCHVDVAVWVGCIVELLTGLVVIILMRTRGVMTVLLCDAALLALGVCIDVDSSWLWKRGIYEDVICIEEAEEVLDLDPCVDRIFGIPLDVKVNVAIWLKMYGVERGDGAMCSRGPFEYKGPALGVPGPWQVVEQINATNGCVEVVSGRRSPVTYEVVSNLFDTIERKIGYPCVVERRLSDDGSLCVGKWAHPFQELEVEMDADSLRLAVRRVP